MENHTSFGGLVRALREHMGKTIKDLASYMNWSIVYLSDIERGRRNPPAVDALKKMALFLQCNEDELIDSANKERKRVEIELKSGSINATDTALLLARRWSDLTEQQLSDIMEILKKKDANEQ